MGAIWNWNKRVVEVTRAVHAKEQNLRQHNADENIPVTATAPSIINSSQLLDATKRRVDI